MQRHECYRQSSKKNLKLESYNQLFSCIQKAFSFVKFAAIGQHEYARDVLQPIDNREEFIQKQKISSFVRATQSINDPEMLENLIKSFYKIEENVFTVEFKLLLMKFLISQAVSGKQRHASAPQQRLAAFHIILLIFFLYFFFYNVMQRRNVATTA